jgi:transcriptional regulator with XRE-family HTH domain
MIGMGTDPDTARLHQEIARRICVLLSAKGNKPPTVYRGIGRDRFWWSRIMKGKSTFTIPDLMAIAELLGVTPNDLLPLKKQTLAEPVSIDEQIERKVLSILEKSKTK